MKPISVLLLLLVIAHAEAQTAMVDGFNQDRLTSVYTEALTFIAPRILEPVPVPDLVRSGLRGLFAFDPELRTVIKRDRLWLLRRDDMVLDTTAPQDGSPATWARMAAALTTASASASAAVRQAGSQAVIQAFFDRMLGPLDPYSRYVPPVEAQEDRSRRAGRAGLGVTLGQRGALIEVQSVVRDSPAAVAGIRPGDVLAAIDGQRVQSQDPAEVGAKLSGAEGSVVAMSWRGRDGRLRDAQLVRAMVPPETVFSQRVTNVLVVRVSGFSNSTASHLSLAVQEALSDPHPVDGIVIDLRDNRGGLLRQAVTAADIFLPAGLVATTVGRDPESRNAWRSTEGELAETLPLIILVDGRTASSAEILAAALADRGRAVVLGSVTVGKGMVQGIDPLPDGGELFITWSQTLAPLGWPVQGLGVLPQVCTSLGQEALDHQLDSLSTGLQPMADAIQRSRAARLPVPAAMVQAIRAACPAADGGAADLEAARRLVDNPAAYAAALFSPMHE